MWDLFSLAAEALGKCPPLLFYLLPAGVFPFLSLAFLFRKKKRGYAYACSLVHTLLFALFLLRFPEREGLLLLSFSLFFNLCFSPLALLRVKKRKKKEKIDPVEAFSKEFLLEEEPLLLEEKKPQKIVVGEGALASGEESYSLERENVSLNHVLAVAIKLKKANLSVSDRLETDNVYRTLNLYREKDKLSQEEFDSLNGFLSTLLKLMAKYSL